VRIPIDHSDDLFHCAKAEAAPLVHFPNPKYQDGFGR
jgi:hypothetical protein